MNIFQTFAILICLAAILNYLNFKWFRLPTTIGLMLLSIGLAMSLLVAGLFSVSVSHMTRTVLSGIDFDQTLLHGILGYLLFAGALHINLDDLRKQQFIVAVMATFGVCIATAVTGLITRLVTHLLGLDLPLVYCLLFGALIAPTDPIAVLAMLKRLGVPKSLETKLAGESLFNDGVGVVIFLAILSFITTGEHRPDESTGIQVAWLFVTEAAGGAFFGFFAGLLAYYLLKSIDDYKTEILISLALVTGGYAMADTLHLSGPIAMVVAGLLIGNHGRTLAMSHNTRRHLDDFWELVDEILNAVLFVLIGLEVMVLNFSAGYLLAGLLAIPVTLLARWISVAGAITAMKLRRDFTPHAIKVITWAGLRGIGVKLSG